MILLTWNIRGLNDPNKVVEINQLIRNHKIAVIGILETKVKVHKTGAIQKKFGSHWCWQGNYSYSPKVGWGGIQIWLMSLF